MRGAVPASLRSETLAAGSRQIPGRPVTELWCSRSAAHLAELDEQRHHGPRGDVSDGGEREAVGRVAHEAHERAPCGVQRPGLAVLGLRDGGRGSEDRSSLHTARSREEGPKKYRMQSAHPDAQLSPNEGFSAVPTQPARGALAAATHTEHVAREFKVLRIQCGLVQHHDLLHTSQGRARRRSCVSGRPGP
jgi:hypothetical protein